MNKIAENKLIEYLNSKQGYEQLAKAMIDPLKKYNRRIKIIKYICA